MGRRGGARVSAERADLNERKAPWAEAKAKRESPPLTGFVALMRGINVGGANKLPMTDLRALFEFWAPRASPLTSRAAMSCFWRRGETGRA